MTALVEIQRSLAWFPAGTPYITSVIDIEIPSAIIGRHAVVPVTGDAAELRILAEAISSGCSGDQREEILSPEIVHPRPRQGRVGYDELSFLIVKISVCSGFHLDGMLPWGIVIDRLDGV